MLMTLAPELLENIVTFLPFHDLKTVRLTCHHLATLTIRFLFRRVRLSFLKTDLDHFSSVAESLHLASVVEELVWYELYVEPYVM